MQSNQQLLYWGTQQLMLGPKLSYQEAKQEPIFLTMAMISLHSNSSLSKQDFMSNLVLTYENHLKVTFLSLPLTPTRSNLVWYFSWVMLIWQDLLDLGARKFGIISVRPIGCCPSHRIYNATGECLEELNDQARAFHATVDSLLRNLS